MPSKAIPTVSIAIRVPEAERDEMARTAHVLHVSIGQMLRDLAHREAGVQNTTKAGLA